MTSTEVNHEIRISRLEGYNAGRFQGNYHEGDEIYDLNSRSREWVPICPKKIGKPINQDSFILRRKIQPAQQDAGPGATVRSYRKLQYGEFLKIGDQYKVAEDPNWLTIPNWWSGDKIRDYSKAEYRRPIDSPAQETPQAHKTVGGYAVPNYKTATSEPLPGEGWRWLVPDVDKKQENDEILIGSHWTKLAEVTLHDFVPTPFKYRRNLAYEGLDALPDGYREAAKANWDRNYRIPRINNEDTLSNCLFQSFRYRDSPEGASFWDDVTSHFHYLDSEHYKLPPIPLYAIVNGKLTCPNDGTGTTRAQAIADNIKRLETELEAARKIK